MSRTLKADFLHWLQPDDSVLALSHTKLRRAIAPIAITAAFGSVLVELGLYLTAPDGAFHLVAIFTYLSLGAIAIRWLKQPPQNSNLAALSVYLGFAAIIGLSMYNQPDLGHFGLLGILSVAAFFFLADRRYLIVSQACGLCVLLAVIANNYETPGWKTSLLLCVATWIAGLSMHFGRISMLQDLVNMTAAFNRETQSREQAQELNVLAQKREQLGAMVGGVAHDFNNLVAGISGGLELALASKNSDQAKDALRVAQESANAAGDLCKSLLEFTRGQPISMSGLDLNILASEAVEHVRLTSPSQISIKLQRDSALGEIVGDHSQIRQIVINLLSNAVDAADSEVICRTGTTEVSEHQWIIISVEDDGPGIAPSIRKNIFDPFFTTKVEGKGLGLATVAASTRAHGGAIEVTSREIGGTQFEVRFPLAEIKPNVPRPNSPRFVMPETKHERTC